MKKINMSLIDDIALFVFIITALYFTVIKPIWEFGTGNNIINKIPRKNSNNINSDDNDRQD